ncbi:MAG: hypothetical protein LBJ47_06485 [Tannerella sp.]|nr:hypothetical protein [Tannerella sp.]
MPGRGLAMTGKGSAMTGRGVLDGASPTVRISVPPRPVIARNEAIQAQA